MSFINLTPYERRILLEGILESDARYLEKLLDKRYKLLLELQLLEGSIIRKSAEVESMRVSLNFLEEYN